MSNVHPTVANDIILSRDPDGPVRDDVTLRGGFCNQRESAADDETLGHSSGFPTRPSSAKKNNKKKPNKQTCCATSSSNTNLSLTKIARYRQQRD